MDAIAEKLDERLRTWKTETANEVRHCVSQIIELADQDALDLLRSRNIEQEVVNLLDKPVSR